MANSCIGTFKIKEFGVPPRSHHGLPALPDGSAGAGEGIRTLDPNLGKVVLYP